MSEQTPPSGAGGKPAEKKDTVRITLPPRPVAPGAYSTLGTSLKALTITLPPRPVAPGAGAQAPTQAAPAVPPRPVGTIPAIPVPPKKQTAPLKKTTGKVPGATKPAMPVVPPPTVRAQAMPQAPTTTPGEAVAPPPTTAAAPPVRPTVKLQTADIPASRPQQPVVPSEGRAQPAPIAAGPSGPTLVDAVLSLLVTGMGAVVAYQIYSVLNM